MIDPDLLDDEAREVWDAAYPDGFWAGGPFNAGDQVRLYAFAQACMLTLGYVPTAVRQAIDPELPGMLQEYMANLKVAHARGELEPDRGRTGVRWILPTGDSPALCAFDRTDFLTL